MTTIGRIEAHEPITPTCNPVRWTYLGPHKNGKEYAMLEDDAGDLHLFERDLSAPPG